MAMINTSLIKSMLDGVTKSTGMITNKYSQIAQESESKLSSLKAEQEANKAKKLEMMNQRKIESDSANLEGDPIMAKFQAKIAAGDYGKDTTTTTVDNTSDTVDNGNIILGNDKPEDTLIGRLSDTWSKFTKGIDDVTIGENSDKTNIFTKAVQAGGKIGNLIGGALGDVTIEALDAIDYFDFGEKLAKATGKAIYNTDTGKKMVEAGISALKEGGDVWNEFADENPNIAGLISGSLGVVEGATSVLGAPAAAKIVGKTATKAATAPIKILKKGSDIAGETTKSVLGDITTGMGKEALDRNIQIAKETGKIIPEKKDIVEIGNKYIKGLENIKDDNYKLYGENYKKFLEVSNKTEKTSMDDLITSFENKASNNFKIDLKTGDRSLTSEIPKGSVDEMLLNKAYETLTEFSLGTKKGATLEDYLSLKKSLSKTLGDAAVDRKGTQVQGLIKQQIKEIDDKIMKIDKSGVYKEMNQSYETMNNILGEITDTLGTDQTKTMTVLTRLNQALKGNTQYRTQMVETLDKLTGSNVLDDLAELAGQDLVGKNVFPKIAAGAGIAAGSYLITPAFLLGLGAASPKVVTTLARTIGYAEGKLQKLVDKIKPIYDKYNKLNLETTGKEKVIGGVVIGNSVVSENNN